MSADAGRAWLAGLPESLAAQRRVIEALLGFCARTPRVTSLSVGCSLGRGAADALSDIDAALGVSDAAAVTAVEALLTEALARPGASALVDLLRHRSPRDHEVRLIFAQFADRTQLDLAIVPQSGIRLGERPDFVLVYGAGEAPGAGDPGSAYAVTGEQVRDWAFHGWIALLDLDKYLRRGSLWEAHERLHQVRHRIWVLWAAATGALYPWHGLSQVLDNDPGSLPPGIEATVAALDEAGLRRAALASAALLATVSEAAAREHPAILPRAMADYATRELARG
jgi:predicted nucleotidyltransferase